MALAVGFRRRLQTGPALRIAPLPLTGLTLSMVFHVALIVAAVIAVNAIKESQPKVYTINLVPAVPAIGRPEVRATTPAPPTARPAPPAPAAPKPERPAPAAPKPELPAPAAPKPELPARTAPELPSRERPRESVGLPDRTLPPRSAAPAPPRPEEKELPSVASSAPPPRIATPAPTAPARETPSAPSAPVGLPTGSAQGKGKLSVETNFPYAWYVKILHDKITERWDPYALPGQQPLISFEIGRNGQVDPSKIRVAQSSGNRNYDKVAMRAIAEAAPFPPVPDEFKDQLVTVNIQFRFEAGRS